MNIPTKGRIHDINLEPKEIFIYLSLIMPQLKQIVELLSILFPQYLQINITTPIIELNIYMY